MLRDNPARGVITASDQVETSYYGLPVIKPPHWRWLVITYFFLGATAGGTFTIATIANLFSKDRAIERVGRYLSLAAVLPCPILLALDLARPDRAFHMFRIVKLRSAMSLGSWALLFLGLFSGLGASLQFLADVTGRDDLLLGARRAVGILGLPFSVFLSGYTGLLMAATNVPLWARFFPFLGSSFLASAFSGSLSAISLVLGLSGEERPDTLRSLSRAESICMGAELTLLSAGLLRLGKLGRPLTAGRWGSIFWPVTVVGGILTPLTLLLSGPVHGDMGSVPRRRITSLLVLVGGFAFRMSMIFAGRESARRPEDYFELTRTPR